jgi:hypothetical protein
MATTKSIAECAELEKAKKVILRQALETPLNLVESKEKIGNELISQVHSALLEVIANESDHPDSLVFGLNNVQAALRKAMKPEENSQIPEMIFVAVSRSALPNSACKEVHGWLTSAACLAILGASDIRVCIVEHIIHSTGPSCVVLVKIPVTPNQSLLKLRTAASKIPQDSVPFYEKMSISARRKAIVVWSDVYQKAKVRVFKTILSKKRKKKSK